MIADKIFDQRLFNERIAARLCSYWAERGYAINTVIVPITLKGRIAPNEHTQFYGIRSDMRDGWPAGRAGA